MKRLAVPLVAILALTVFGCASSGTTAAVTDYRNHPGFCSQADYDTYKVIAGLRAGILQSQADFSGDQKATQYVAAAKASFNVLSDSYVAYHAALHVGGDVTAVCSIDPAVLRNALALIPTNAMVGQAQADLTKLIAIFKKERVK